MKPGPWLAVFLLLGSAPATWAQQVADMDYKPSIPSPAYETGKGPRVAVDEAHHNFHTVGERYAPFAQLLRRDGYRVDGLKQALSPEALKAVEILVIANPLHPSNEENWDSPNPSAFTPREIEALRAWVNRGGSLFLIVDHMPFPGAAGELAKAFGVTFSNGFAILKSQGQPTPFEFKPGQGLMPSAVIAGRSPKEKVDRVITFVGSAFKAPGTAVPVFSLDAGYVSLEPQKCWQFKADTPSISLDGWCHGALLKPGKGRVAVFGEAAMFTAQLAGPGKMPTGMNTPEAGQNAQFLLNILHWLSRAKGMPD